MTKGYMWATPRTYVYYINLCVSLQMDDLCHGPVYPQAKHRPLRGLTAETEMEVRRKLKQR